MNAFIVFLVVALSVLAECHEGESRSIEGRGKGKYALLSEYLLFFYLFLSYKTQFTKLSAFNIFAVARWNIFIICWICVHLFDLLCSIIIDETPYRDSNKRLFSRSLHENLYSLICVVVCSCGLYFRAIKKHPLLT